MPSIPSSSYHLHASAFGGGWRPTQPVPLVNGTVLFAFEGMALPGPEVRKGHVASSSDLGVYLVHLSGESMRRKPLDHRVRIDKRLIKLLRGRLKNAVKLDRTSWTCLSLFVA